jgi:hypothetical protein
MSFAITASVVVAVGTTAYNARNQRKAQERAERQGLIQKLTIEGQAPQLLDVSSDSAANEIMGSDISQALATLQYDPNAGFEQMLQAAPQQQMEVPPEVLEQLMMEQQTQFASGGPVGRPEDTYYFSVEDIQGMMQEPDPMMQAVGAGLMGQMPPGGGMVPATPGQIQMMANGGQPLYRSEGGITAVKKLENTLSELVGINPKDVEWASSLSEEMYPGEELDGRGDAARHIALGSLIAKAEHPNAAEALSVLREYIPIPDSGRKMDMFNNDLGMTLTGSKPEIKKQIRELIENNTAMYMELDESQKMRGY